MARGYKCDFCGDLEEGDPHRYIGWGKSTDGVVSVIEADGRLCKGVCAECWREFVRLMERAGADDD